MSRVVVVGAGVAGLGAALLLARREHSVILCEQEARPAPSSVADAADWSRRAVPQLHQSHVFLARCREVLRAHAPDVLDGLRAAGVPELRLTDHPPRPIREAPTPSEELTALLSRRPVFELVLRRHALAEPLVDHRPGTAIAGLEVDSSEAPPRVWGARTADGGVVPADMVVDATGRRSPLPAWLSAAGVAAPVETAEDCGIVYYSRFYQRAAGAPWPGLNRGHTGGGSFDRYSCLVFPADNGTLSVTFGITPEDRELKALRHDAAFHAAAASIPVIAEWVEADWAAPIGAVQSMGGMRNRSRRLTDDHGRPLVVGVQSVGDALGTTNPAHSRGCSLAMAHAVGLADALDAHRDPVDQTMAMDEIRRRDVDPWVHDSVAQDRQRLRRWSDKPRAQPFTLATPRLTNGRAFSAAQHDPWVWDRFTRAQHLLDPPETVLDDPAVARRVRAVEQQGLGFDPPAGPNHDELAGLLVDAASSRR